MNEKTGKQVVILVDEYDKPLLETMEVNPVQEERNRDLYKSFFSVLKDEDQYLKFVFITGVTKFSKVSIFSDLNQLNDISLSDRYACICGITEKELEGQFRPEIHEMAQENDQTDTECLDQLAEMYDGYHFSKKSEGVYNPFSLLNAFYNHDYANYWFSTRTPTFLIHKLERSAFTAEQFTDGVRATEDSLMNYRPDNPDPIPLFYQSGYLTICGWYREYRVYRLRFPNHEVEYGFMNSLMEDTIPKNENTDGFFIMDYVNDLDSGNIDSFMNRLTAVFASIPYTEKKSYESEWRNEIYLFLKLRGILQ